MGFIKFLGTAGARFVMMRQLRSSAGLWLAFKSTNIIIDPGPGSIVKCNSSRPKIDPTNLDAIILTHKHLDHSGDANVMIEAMTEGGFRKRGTLFVPSDALGEDGVVFSYLKSHPEKVTLLKKGKFSVGDIKFEVPVRNRHPVETYGLKFFIAGNIVSLIADTEFFDDLIDIYKGSTLLVGNVIFYQKRESAQHLCLEEALRIVKAIKPQKAIFTHFGMSMIKQKLFPLEGKIRQELGMDIKFAYDGLSVELPLTPGKN